MTCPTTNIFGSCLVADLTSVSLVEYTRQYAYIGTPGLTANADRSGCVDDGNWYVPAGASPDDQVSAIVCPAP